MEIGCGVGNFMYPLLKLNKSIFVYACDFSTDAIQVNTFSFVLLKLNIDLFYKVKIIFMVSQLLKTHADYDTQRCLGFVCDITKPNLLRDSMPADVKVDFVTLIFVMSALHPDKMQIAVENISQVRVFFYFFNKNE